MALAPALQVSHQPLREAGVLQRGRADAHERRSGQYVLHHVFAVATPPTPITGTYTARDTCHVASTPTGRIAAPLTPPVPKPSAGRRRSTSITSPGSVLTTVIPSAPRSTATSRRRGNVRAAWRQLDEQRARRAAAGPRHQIRAARDGSAPNSMPPRRTLGQLTLSSNAGTPVSIRQRRDHVPEIVDRAADTLTSTRARREMRREPRQVVSLHRLQTRVREADGVDHPAGELGHARSRRTRTRLDADRFGHESAEAIQIHHVGQLAAVACRAGGEDDRILELDSRRLDAQRGRDGDVTGAAVAHAALRSAPGTPRSLRRSRWPSSRCER